jgi:threonine synthase
VVSAFEAGSTKCDYWQDAHTIATGLCVPKSFADQLILKDIRDSQGMAISVTDLEIKQFQQRLSQTEGIFSCPEGAATLAALDKMVKRQSVEPDETIVLFNTGSGLKYVCA